MLTFLFWNIHNADLDPLVTRLTERHRVDVVMLAECVIPAARLLGRLNSGTDSGFFLAADYPHIVAVYTRFAGDFLIRLSMKPRYTIWHLMLPARPEILLATAHLRSKGHRDETEQAYDCRDFGEDIRRAENQVGHERTLVVGDLNMNPFGSGMVQTKGLNAAMTRDLAKRRGGARVFELERYPYFYNPMWRFFGDSGHHPPGTCYYDSSLYFWNIYDQVLIRPSLLGCFQNEALRILDSDGSTSFLSKNGLPACSTVSDHLPVLFQLEL